MLRLCEFHFNLKKCKGAGTCPWQDSRCRQWQLHTQEVTYPWRPAKYLCAPSTFVPPSPQNATISHRKIIQRPLRSLSQLKAKDVLLSLKCGCSCSCFGDTQTKRTSCLNAHTCTPNTQRWSRNSMTMIQTCIQKGEDGQTEQPLASGIRELLSGRHWGGGTVGGEGPSLGPFWFLEGTPCSVVLYGSDSVLWEISPGPHLKWTLGSLPYLEAVQRAQSNFLPVQSWGPVGCLRLEQSKFLLVWAHHFFGTKMP